jgi:hypothetical protein
MENGWGFTKNDPVEVKEFIFDELANFYQLFPFALYLFIQL